jgi:hypothetical protein
MPENTATKAGSYTTLRDTIAPFGVGGWFTDRGLL